jgi:hypothetical protein
MRLGIMQPYFFPYLGHFALIAHTDVWVVFDITQYTPKTWMSRNRVLHPIKGWNYITVPISNSSIHIKTCEARVLDMATTHKSILGKLSHYRRKAPYFNAVIRIVDEVFASPNSDLLVNLNARTLRSVCQYLDIPFSAKICSELGLPLPPNLGPGEWALEISSRLGAHEYINPDSGRHLFDPRRFREHDISLHFLQFDDFVYETPSYQFENNLSVLDVLMWNDPRIVHEKLLANSRLISANDRLL